MDDLAIEGRLSVDAREAGGRSGGGTEPARRQTLRIVHINTHETRGGAAQAAWNLHRVYRRRGVASWMAVKRKETDDAAVVIVPNERSKPRATRALLAAAERVGGGGSVRRVARRALYRLAEPRRWWDIRRGIEDFHYPGTWKLFDLLPEAPDLIHCHNLHGGYFDLRALPWLSRRVPVVLNLHDAWTLSGHCAHSLECERWKIGCGQCPDLTIPPAIHRDATASNWRRKQRIYSQCRLYVATPSRWLMGKVEASMLARSVVEARIIPYGVDLSVFRPGDKTAARNALGIPKGHAVLLLSADGIRGNVWKDYRTAREAVALASRHVPDLVLIALGETAPPERIGRAEVRFVPFQRDPAVVARYYQAADVYVHPARADTFPNAVLEALACGTPVVATAVGGIPEQVRSLPLEADGGSEAWGSRAEATGLLVPAGDVEGMAAALARLLTDFSLRQRLGLNAAEDARRRFDVEREATDFLGWYEEILGRSRGGRPLSRGPFWRAADEG